MAESDLAIEALLEFLNACEAGITAAKQRIKEKKAVDNASKRESDQPGDMGGIVWRPETGSKGPFEKSEDRENPRFQALLRTLQSHSGKMSLDGYFLWIFPNGNTIGRKRKV